MPRIGTSLGVGPRRATLRVHKAAKAFGLETDVVRRSRSPGQQNEMTRTFIFQMPEWKFETIRFQTARRDVGENR